MKIVICDDDEEMLCQIGSYCNKNIVFNKS